MNSVEISATEIDPQKVIPQSVYTQLIESIGQDPTSSRFCMDKNFQRVDMMFGHTAMPDACVTLYDSKRSSDNKARGTLVLNWYGSDGLVHAYAKIWLGEEDGIVVARDVKPHDALENRIDAGSGIRRVLGQGTNLILEIPYVPLAIASGRMNSSLTGTFSDVMPVTEYVAFLRSETQLTGKASNDLGYGYIGPNALYNQIQRIGSPVVDVLGDQTRELHAWTGWHPGEALGFRLYPEDDATRSWRTHVGVDIGMGMQNGRNELKHVLRRQLHLPLKKEYPDPLQEYARMKYNLGRIDVPYDKYLMRLFIDAGYIFPQGAELKTNYFGNAELTIPVDLDTFQLPAYGEMLPVFA